MVMSVDSKMTAIADKIRGLLGLTGEMGLDAMATNLGTEQANVTAALTALAEKGVDVPAGSNSNALVGLIAAIEAGGGGLEFAQGTFACSTDVFGSNSSSHGTALRNINVGFVPDVIIMVLADYRNVTRVDGMYVLSFATRKTLATEMGIDLATFVCSRQKGTTMYEFGGSAMLPGGNGLNPTNDYVTTVVHDDGKMKIQYYGTCGYPAGYTYYWLAVKGLV